MNCPKKKREIESKDCTIEDCVCRTYAEKYPNRLGSKQFFEAIRKSE